MQRIDKDEVKRFWESRAQRYKKSTYQGITNFADDKKSIQMDKIDKIELDNLIVNEKEILDVGCGVGRLSFWLSSRADKVIGIDYAKPLIEIANKEAVRRNINNVEFLCEKCTNFELGRKFNTIIVFGLLIYMDDKDVIRTIKQLKKHLARDGRIILKESVGTSGRFLVLDKYSEELDAKYNAIYRTPKELIDMFENNGFKRTYDKKLYQHRKETGVWLFIFRGI